MFKNFFKSWIWLKQSALNFDWNLHKNSQKNLVTDLEFTEILLNDWLNSCTENNKPLTILAILDCFEFGLKST